MESYGADSGAGQGGFNGQEIQQTMQAIQQQIQVQATMDIMQAMNEKCFNRCITKPTKDLGNSERQCIAKCSDRFQEGLEITNKTIIQRSLKDAQAMQSSGGSEFAMD